VSQDFEVNYRIEDVLSQRADTVITSVQCGVGSIIVDGEILVSAILLQSREKKDIIRENKIMPFRAEIECEDAMPSMCATAFAKEKFFRTDISVDQERGKSLISASVTLILSGEVFGAENLSIVADAFSINDNLIVEKDECAFVKPCDVRSESKEICITAVTDSLPVGTSLIDCIGEKAEADAIFRYIATTEIEYFSNMHLKELPFFQALSFNYLGEELKGQHLITKYVREWSKIKDVKDNGYFGTTPFFIPFVDEPARLRKAQYLYLTALCENYMGEKKKAKEFLKESVSLNNDNMSALFFERFI
jgi:hypothetical protein